MRKIAPDGLPAFRPSMRKGYFFAALAALAYGSTPIMLRSVVEREGLGGSLGRRPDLLCRGSVAIAMIRLWPGQLRHVLAMDRRSAKWFTWSESSSALSQMFLYMALACAGSVCASLQIQPCSAISWPAAQPAPTKCSAAG